MMGEIVNNVRAESRSFGAAALFDLQMSPLYPA